jgi:hypothetical protein
MYNENFYNLHLSSDIISVIKSRRLKWRNVCQEQTKLKVR